MQGSASRPRGEDLRVLVDAVADGLVLVRAGRVAWTNAPLACLAGVGSPHELHGKPLEDLFPDAGEDLPRPGNGRRVAWRLVRPDGGVRSVVVESVPVSGKCAELAYVVRDVTEQRALEAEIVRVGRALREAQQQRSELGETVRRGLGEREELLTLVSHELRTPVTVIAGYNRLLLSGKVGDLNEQQRRFVEESQKSCQRLNSFIANLLEKSRAVVDQSAIETRAVPLRPTIEAVAGLLEPLLRERRLTLALDLCPAAPRACFDPPRIEQVLTNLIGNAIKFTPPGGCIEVSTRRLEDASRPLVEVAVSDDGPGVADEDRERIFEPYVQGAEARGKSGLGLGLAICRSIVLAHHGAIGVRKRAGGGSCFAFTLPRADQLAEEGG